MALNEAKNDNAGQDSGPWNRFAAQYAADYGVDLNRMAGAGPWRDWIGRGLDEDALMQAMAEYADTCRARGYTSAPGLRQLQDDYLSLKRAKVAASQKFRPDSPDAMPRECGLCGSTGWVKAVGDILGRVYDVRCGEAVSGYPYVIPVPCLCSAGEAANDRFATRDKDGKIISRENCYTSRELARLKALAFSFYTPDSDILAIAEGAKRGGGVSDTANAAKTRQKAGSGQNPGGGEEGSPVKKMPLHRSGLRRFIPAVGVL